MMAGIMQKGVFGVEKSFGCVDYWVSKVLLTLGDMSEKNWGDI
jgi:hypothetical protein